MPSQSCESAFACMYAWPRSLALHDAMPQDMSQVPLKSACMRLGWSHLYARKSRLKCKKACVHSTAHLTIRLLLGEPAGLPKSKQLDYWATLSRCLTDLEVSMGHRDKQHLTPLQPAYLNELTRLTRLSFSGLMDPNSRTHGVDGPPYALELPELKDLRLKCLWASHLELQCTQLKRLRIESCAIGKLSLQASLKHLHHGNSALCILHEGFPITNLIGLTYLSLDGCTDTESEAMLFQGLPYMTRLQIMELYIGMCSLPASLPSSLRELTLFFSPNRV